MPNIPMIATIARPALLLPIAALLYFNLNWAAMFVFIIASLSDALDGYLARRMNLVSDLGAVADQVADKAFIIGMLVLLAWSGRLDGAWVAVALLLIAREFAVIALREWSAGCGKAIPVAKMGKLKTATQMISIGLLLAFPSALIFGQIFLLIALILSVASARVYFKS